MQFPLGNISTLLSFTVLVYTLLSFTVFVFTVFVCIEATVNHTVIYLGEEQVGPKGEMD